MIDRIYEGKTDDEWYDNRKNPGVCQACYGCGKIATDDDKSPWFAWATLPRGSDLAVRMGLIKSVDCPKCNGTGKSA